MTGQETETRTKTRARTGLLVMQNCHESGKCNYILVDDVDEQPRTEAQSQLQPQLQSQPPSRHFILDRAQYVHINCIMSHRPTLATRNFEANKFSPPLPMLASWQSFATCELATFYSLPNAVVYSPGWIGCHY